MLLSHIILVRMHNYANAYFYHIMNYYRVKDVS